MGSTPGRSELTRIGRKQSVTASTKWTSRMKASPEPESKSFGASQGRMEASRQRLLLLSPAQAQKVPLLPCALWIRAVLASPAAARLQRTLYVSLGATPRPDRNDMYSRRCSSQRLPRLLCMLQAKLYLLGIMLQRLQARRHECKRDMPK
jgi:hypothetical protein